MSIPIMHSTRCVLLFSLVLPAFGATSILSVEPTQMQAKITVRTDQSGFCIYRASRGTFFSSNIPDLVDNTNTDARGGAIVNPGAHIFILGTRRANDALAAAATYWVGVTCGTDSEVSAVFTTRPIQWGNTAPDIVPFNSAKFGNMDHPAIDFNNTATASTFCDPVSHSYCDPNTGVEYWPVSKPGWGTQAAIDAAQFASTTRMATPIDVSATGKFTNSANAAFHGTPSVFTTATGGATDKLFIPLASQGCTQGGVFGGFGNACTWDDISFSLWCGNATTNNVTGFNLQLTIDGGQTLVGNQITTGNCPSGAPSFRNIWPGNTTGPVANPIFKGWGYVPQRNMVVPPGGTVSVSGTAVALTNGSPGPGNYFNMDWATGTPILINGSYAHLAAPPVTSSNLTIVENLGTLTNVAYSGANFGVVVTKTNSSSTNVDFTLGMNYAFSQMPDQGVNGDHEMINGAFVSVSKSADGTTCGIYTVGCSSGTLSPAVKGYLGTLQTVGGPALFLWIPRNSDGSPRGETRLMSLIWKAAGSSRTNGNGDSLGGGSIQLTSGGLFFDDVDGTSVYTTDNSHRVWKLSYINSGACAGYVAFHPWPTSGDYNFGAIADDCFEWTVITPLAGGHDLKTQFMGTLGNNGAYQSGLNYLGQTVGTAHTGYDLSWMANNVGAQEFDSGFLIASTSAGSQNHLSILAALGDDGSGNGTFVLKSIHDQWSEPGTRWAGSHSCPETSMGSYVFCAYDPLDNTGRQDIIFPNRNQAVVSQVNRTGFGSPTAWSSTTSLSSNTDFFTCPSSLPAPYTSLSGTANCLQVRVNTPFCQFTPNTTFTFIDGKHEAAEFPCTTPGFGVANAAYSKLQDIQVGDYLYFSDTGPGVQERAVVLTSPVYNSATDITFWILRMAGFAYQQPTYGGNALDETNGVGHSASGQSCCTHSTTGWALAAGPTGASSAIDVSNGTNQWLVDNPLRFAGHGVAGPGSLAGTYNYSQANCGPRFDIYCGSSNLTPAASVNIPFSNTATVLPAFAGIAQPAIGIQSYQNASYAQGVTPLPFFVDFKAINPSSPGGAEGFNSYGSMSLSLVSGTTKTYLAAADCCTPSPDYKRWGLQGYAGRYWMKDVSSPATFGSIANMSDWSVCLARNVNECVFGSIAGQYYMTLPHNETPQTTCFSANFGLAIPCISSFGPISGQIVQFRNDRYDATGLSYRKFGFAHSHVGLGYPFSNCRTTPGADFVFCPGYWLDGVRTDWLALRIGALPPLDNVNRTTFLGINIIYQGVPFASNLRARFGYAENGGDLLQCTAYQQDCSTEIPSGSPNAPFSFTNEAVTRQACANGASCSITIPSLPNRILYYIVDRLDSNGNVLETSPMQAVAVP
jgi:hypothetical protein